MTNEFEFNHQPDLPGSITVICLAEAAAPAESLVWMLADKAIREISRRVEVMALPLSAPELLKMRSLSPKIKELLASSSRVALIAGLRMDHSDEPVIHFAHHGRGNIIHPPGAVFGASQIVTDSAQSDPILFGRQQPKPWTSDDAVPLINTLITNGEAMAMPVWLEDDLPAGGFDFLGIPLPAAESSDWLLPQLGAQFPAVVQALTDLIWPMVHDIAPPQAGKSVG